jgi:2-aminoadipate transaminase
MTDDLINLTRGVPPMEVLPVDDMIKASEAAFRNDGKTLLQYTHAPGYPPLLDLLAERHHVKRERIFTGNSSLEVMDFITHITLKPGLRAFTESPSYDRANTLLLRSGAEVVGIPLEVDGMNLDVFEAELKKGAPSLLYVIADFQNPMGTTTSEAKRRQISKWAQEYDFYIMEDAPYRTLRYKGEDVPSFLSLAPERVFHMCSFSKLLAPGLRLGYVIAPEEQVRKLTTWATDTYIGPVGPSQGMVYEYVRSGKFDENVKKLKSIYAPRLEALEKFAGKYIPGAVFPKPEGGFFIGLQLPQGNKMEPLLKQAAEINLKISDGRGFFLNPSDGECFLRVPFCTLSPEQIDEALKRLSTIVVQ